MGVSTLTLSRKSSFVTEAFALSVWIGRDNTVMVCTFCSEVRDCFSLVMYQSST